MKSVVVLAEDQRTRLMFSCAINPDLLRQMGFKTMDELARFEETRIDRLREILNR